MQAAEAPNSESEINSNGTTNTITVKKKRKFLDSQNVYDFCIIIYKWIILFDLKVMKDRTGIFRKGFAVVVWCQNLNFIFYVQKTLIFLKDGMVTNFSVNFEPQMSFVVAICSVLPLSFEIALIHLSEIIELLIATKKCHFFPFLENAYFSLFLPALNLITLGNAIMSIVL